MKKTATPAAEPAAAQEIQSAVAPAATPSQTPAAALEVKIATAVAAASRAERERCEAIITSKSADGRAKLALHLAFETDRSATQAVAILDAAGIESSSRKLFRLDGNVPTFNLSSFAPDGSSPAEQWGSAVAQVNQETKQSSGR